VQRGGGERQQATLDVVEQRVVGAGGGGRRVGRFHPHILPVLQRTRVLSEGMFAFAQRCDNLLQRMLICAQCAVKNRFI
jgi:hypothetical protein